LTLLNAFDPLVLNVPGRITKEGSKIETLTVKFRREFLIKKSLGKEAKRYMVEEIRKWLTDLEVMS